jgi:hypothetical protein
MLKLVFKFRSVHNRTVPTDEKLSCVISGSFKFKPEIDEIYDELQDNNIQVRAPEKGWLYMVRRQIIRLEEAGTLRPLPSEKDMPTAMIEQEFIRQLHLSDFVYLANFEDYVGASTAFEIGSVMAGQKPIYTHKPLDIEFMDKWQDWNPSTLELIDKFVRVVPIPEIEADCRQNPSTDYLAA